MTVSPILSTAVSISVCLPALNALMLTLATDDTVVQSTTQLASSSKHVMLTARSTLATSATAIASIKDVGLRGADDQLRPMAVDGVGVRE